MVARAYAYHPSTGGRAQVRSASAGWERPGRGCTCVRGRAMQACTSTTWLRLQRGGAVTEVVQVRAWGLLALT